MDGIDFIASKGYACADFADTQKNKRFEKHSPDVKNKKCPHIACTKTALLGMAGTRTPEFCGQHAKGRMVNIKNKSLTRRGCGKPLSLGVDGRGNAEYLAQ